MHQHILYNNKNPIFVICFYIASPGYIKLSLN